MRAVQFVPLAALLMVLSGRIVAQDQPATPSFPDPVNTEADTTSRALPAEEAARGFRVPEGFQITVAAAEPDVQNPIAMAWDARGRLWVAENYTYADRTKKFDLSLRDRVLILEDADGDGRFERRTVFTDDLQMLTGIALGYGGVWLMTPPQLIFIPDRNGDDKPDGAPIVVLDGFTPATDNHHTFANGLKWGPDGWLYGRCGASSPGRVGLPGTPDEQRIPLFGGVWRFRTQPAALQGQAVTQDAARSPFEVLCHGTTNPWGMDWNEHGEAFFINTVNGHLWHVIPGAHFRRPHSEDPNPYVYATIDTHADHYHWDTGKDWSDSRKVTGEHDRLGGGHAHSGATIYLGDNWPSAYRGKLMTLNLHGRRVNVDRLDREGTGYEGRHEPDILHAADPWFRGIDLNYGPDGSVYLLDWSDTGECHEHTGVHRTSGRIYKVSFGRNAAQPVNVNAADFTQLVELHRHRNEWFVRQARQTLVDRLYRAPGDDPNRATVCTTLMNLFDTEQNVELKLRALWTLRSLDATDNSFLLKQTRHPDEHIRVWAVRLLVDDWPLDTIMGHRPKRIEDTGNSVTSIRRELIRMATEDESPLVRLALASALQRLPWHCRLELATPLASRVQDANDANLPLMVWYGVMPVAASQPGDLALFASGRPFPSTRRMIARRLAELIDEHPKAVESLLAGATQKEVLVDVLTGLSEGFAGRHKVTCPANWTQVQSLAATIADTGLAERVRDLSVLFGDGRALDEVRRIALDGKADLAARRLALQTLIDIRAADRRQICEQLLSVRYLNSTAIRGLTEFDDPAIGDRLAKNYRSFFPSDRPAVIDALVSRPSFAGPLLDQVAAGRIPRSEVTVVHARQIRSFGNERLTEKLNEIWGELRDSPEDRQQLIALWKSRLTSDSLAQADKGSGRAVFNKACANCHRLYGHGAQIGPDLTGSGRQNLDYVLINLIDPSAAVGVDYRMSIVSLNDGRVMTGIIAVKTDKSITLQTAKDRVAIERTEIDELKTSTQSLMPDGLLQPLTEEQVRDLVAYLMSPTQVPLRE